MTADDLVKQWVRVSAAVVLSYSFRNISASVLER